MPSTDGNAGIAMALVILAGLATGIGASVVFFPSLVRFASNKSLAAALGFSAGVMLYVSFVEVLDKSQSSFEDAGFTHDQSRLYSTLCFFSGVVLMVLLNQVVTLLLGGHHHKQQDHQKTRSSKDSLQDDDDDDDLEDELDSIPPCICHDEHPVDTLNKVKDMAHSMAEHPDRPHPHGQKHHHDQGSEHGSKPLHLGESSVIDSKGREMVNRRPPNQSSVATLEKQEQAVQVDFDEAYEKAKSNELEPAESVSQQFKVNQTVFEDKGTPPRIIETNECDVKDDEHSEDEDEDDEEDKKRKLMMMSMNTALAIGLHNFPEGLATFVAGVEDPRVGLVLAIAIAIHNIPEGLCVAMPIYYATGNRWKAFLWALMSGMAEVLAGLLAWLILYESFSDELNGILFSVVAGMMVIISVRELLPTAHRYDPEDTVVTFSFIGGMSIMAFSLMMFLIT